MSEALKGTQEAEIEAEFERLLSRVGFSREELQKKYKGKKFVDLGCGLGDFINRLLHYRVTNTAYGVDVNPKSLESGVLSTEHFVQVDYMEELPDKLKGADVVTAMHSVYRGEETTERYEKILSFVGTGGEFRQTPIPFIQGSAVEKQIVFRTVQSFCEGRDFTFEFRFLDSGKAAIVPYDPANPPYAEVDNYVLIIRKPLGVRPQVK